MTELSERVAVEFENIDRTLSQLPPDDRCAELSILELAGVAALLHDFYNGIENVLKQMIKARDTDLPTGPSWHRELIELASDHDVISQEVAEELRRYLAFRHFFSHGYSLDLNPEQIRPLVRDAGECFCLLRSDIEKATGADS